MVGETEKVVQAVEKVSGPVDMATAIAAILIGIVALMFLYKTFWPLLKKYMDDRVTKNQERNENMRKMSEIGKSQEKNEKQIEEMSGMIRQLAGNMEQLCNQMQEISIGYNGGYKIIISVLLDIINCMDGSTSPENCAKEAKEKVNAYFREGKLPPLVD